MATKAEVAARTERLVQTLRDRAKTFAESDDNYLHFIRHSTKFHRYSISNQFLIMAQYDDATAVNSFKRWIALGRCVRKGESAIWILAPRPYTGKDLRGEDEQRITFRYVPVFAYEQTDPLAGAPYVWEPYRFPVLTEETGGDHIERLLATLVESGVEYRPFEDKRSYRGRFIPPQFGQPPVIELNTTMAMLQQLNTLVHEVAHYEHSVASGETFGSFTKDVHEFVAESAAYAVLAELGFDSSGKSVAYIAMTGQIGNDPEKEKQAMKMVVDTVGSVMERLQPSQANAESKEEGEVLSA